MRVPCDRHLRVLIELLIRAATGDNISASLRGVPKFYTNHHTLGALLACAVADFAYVTDLPDAQGQ
jgi:hypothetical protein